MRKLFYLCLAIIFGFLGAVTPVILPKRLTASTQEVSIRKAKLSLTPVEWKNAIEVDGISMTIPMLDPFVLPLPKQQSDAPTPIELNAVIKNKRQTPVRLHRSYFLIPELVGSNGKILSPKLAPNRSEKTQPPNCKLLAPDVNLTVSTEARLFWQNNKLQFAGSDRFGNGWNFEDLEPGTYLMGLKYINTYGESTCLDRKNRERETIKIDELVTPFIKFHVVEPVPDDNKAIEINGIRFETVIFPQKLTIPPNRPNAKTLVKLGIKITNNQYEGDGFRFKLCCGIAPEIIDSNGKKIQNKGLSFGLKPLTESDFPLIFPEESAEFVVDGILSWRDNLLTFIGENGTRGVWIFEDLKPDTYQIRFTYRDNSKEIELFGFYESRRFTGFWTGEVVTPLVKVDLMSTAN